MGFTSLLYKISLLLAIPFVISCEIADVAKETKNAVEGSNQTSQEIKEQVTKTKELTEEVKKNLDKTADAIHLQTLTVALQGLLAPGNTENLTPPLRMMPYAEAFSREATPLELIKAAYVFLVDVVSSPPDAKKARIISLVALSALGAFCPEEIPVEAGLYHP